MAQFYAHIRGAKGPTSRLGTKQSGITTTTKSWAGEVNVNMYHDAKNDMDMVYVTLGRHGGGASITLFTGPVNTWQAWFDHPSYHDGKDVVPVGELGKQALVLQHMPMAKLVFRPAPHNPTTE